MNPDWTNEIALLKEVITIMEAEELGYMAPELLAIRRAQLVERLQFVTEAVATKE